MKNFDITIIKSARRSFSIEIDQGGKVILRAPNRSSQKDINQLLEEKSNWIEKKVIEMKNRKREKVKKHFIDGETFDLLGKKYTLRVLENYEYALSYTGEELIMNKNAVKHGELLIENWYRNQAKFYITNRAIEISKSLKIPINRVSINGAKTRWGSCSIRKNLNFTWRLVMAPKQVVDYVIVHEIAHIIEMNHSDRFWGIVRKILPNYLIYKTWLKENGHLLEI
jgi:hypothetical protein